MSAARSPTARKFWIPRAVEYASEARNPDHDGVPRGAGVFTGIVVEDGAVNDVDYVDGTGEDARYDLVVKREERIRGTRHYGLYTNGDIFDGECVGEVTGIVKSDGAGGPYCVGSSDFIVDSSICGNEFRFLNHYQGLSTDGDANCMYVVPLARSGSPVGRVLVFSTRHITAGEQLLVRYGSDGVEREHPLEGYGSDDEVNSDVEWVEVDEWTRSDREGD